MTLKPARMLPEVITHLFKKQATSRYPFEKARVTARFRGRIAFDSGKCIGCQLCVRVCPSKAIEIPLSDEQFASAPVPEGQTPVPAKKKFDCIMKLGSCVYCWQCAETCPKQALITTQDFELAQRDPAKLVRHYK